METVILQHTSDFQEGDHIDQYVLLECVQIGGEGALWTARHQDNHQIVIMKFVSKQDWHSIELFEVERAPILELDHPNIREVYSTGMYNEIPFTCMRFYPSGSVQGLIDERKLSTKEILKIAAQITSALDYIHSRRIVHRDLKPTNMLIDSDMHVYLTDFGLARQVSESTRLFHTGHGSAPYSPPEQHVREEITPRSDIYSFGIVLYRLFSGELPWNGKVALAIKQLESNTQLPEDPLIGLGLPDDLIDGLRKLTEREPEKRPKSAVEGFGIIASILEGNAFCPVTYEEGKKYLDKFLSSVPPFSTPNDFERREAQEILERSTELWVMGNRGFDLSRTEFSFLDSVLTLDEASEIDMTQNQFQMMAFGAIKYAVNYDYWWRGLNDQKLKVELVDLVIHEESPKSIDRNLDLIVRHDQDLFSSDDAFTSLILSLLEVMKKVSGDIIGSNALRVLELLAKPGKNWGESILPTSAVDQLAEIALTGEQYSVDAAKLIGTLRIKRSVEIIWQKFQETEEEQVFDILILINKLAGDLPRFIPWDSRLNLAGRVALEQLAAQRDKYFRTFLFTALNIAIGIGFYVFISFRLPSIFNTARILSSFGSGLLIGPIIGFGLFASETIVKYLEILKRIPRVILGTGIGSVFVSLGFIVFHTLFLDNPPAGVVIVISSIFIVLGVSIGASRTSSRIIRALIGFIFAGLAFWGSGYFSIGTDQTPLLYYDFNETLATLSKIAVTSLFFGLINTVNRSKSS